MQHRLLSLLRQMGLGLSGAVAATVLTLLLYWLHVPELARMAPFLFLCAVLACAWFGGYAAGIVSIVVSIWLASILTRKAIDLSETEFFRLALLVLLSCAVSWIESYRHRREVYLRERVDRKTEELRATVRDLEREIRERKAAEEEVRRLNHMLEWRVDERTRQLEISNTELESFSYSVSHDLRAPLRSIDGFSRILLGTCDAKLEDEERALFQRIVEAAARMNELIDDLLNLSRVTRTSMTSEQVNLTGLATCIANTLRSNHPASNAHFIIEPGISVACDGHLMEVVLQNLLENAWKFSSQTPEPCIEFGATSMQGERVLFVRDNGAGFDPAHKDRLFTPFQRLHRQDEFPGTGIGLATVSRIVHRHGGWITAESQPGKGATFFFTLAPPAKPIDCIKEGSPVQSTVS